MNKEKELLQKFVNSRWVYDDWCLLKAEAEELLTQPEQTEQEPYCWEVSNLFENNKYIFSKPRDEVYSKYNVIPLYRSPPKPKPLSDEKIEKSEPEPVAYILKEKETGYKTQVAYRPSVLKKGWEAIPLHLGQPLELGNE